MYITMRDLNGEDWKQIHFKTMKISLIMYSNKMQKGKTVFQLDMFQLKKVIFIKPYHGTSARTDGMGLRRKKIQSRGFFGVSV